MPASGPSDGDRTKVIAGKYDVRGVLGEGGTGIVYDARRIADGAPVAVKVMHPELAGDAQIRGRFQREAAVLGRLDGPHVCPILELGEVESEEAGKTVLFIALPRIEGSSLEAVLRESDTMPVERVLDVMLQICDALRSAHARGIIHRDLKPANVMLERGERVVVVDFGLSKIVTGGAAGTTNLTTRNMLLGTPEYMSPEQARGDELDARCDVYAAGVILYEMLTGTPPFTGETPLTVLTAHLTSELEPPSRRLGQPGRVSPALESVVLHALARDRERRYPSARALSEAIVRARARPEDEGSVRPEALSGSADVTDELATTLPVVSAAPPVGSLALDGAQPISDTLLSAPLAPAPRRDPEIAAAIASSPPKAGAPEPLESPASDGGSTRTWVLLWILAALASVSVGVYLALR